MLNIEYEPSCQTDNLGAGQETTSFMKPEVSLIYVYVEENKCKD
jgi:hypothetical protein